MVAPAFLKIDPQGSCASALFENNDLPMRSALYSSPHTIVSKHASIDMNLSNRTNGFFRKAEFEPLRENVAAIHHPAALGQGGSMHIPVCPHGWIPPAADLDDCANGATCPLPGQLLPHSSSKMTMLGLDNPCGMLASITHIQNPLESLVLGPDEFFKSQYGHADRQLTPHDRYGQPHSTTAARNDVFVDERQQRDGTSTSTPPPGTIDPRVLCESSTRDQYAAAKVRFDPTNCELAVSPPRTNMQPSYHNRRDSIASESESMGKRRKSTSTKLFSDYVITPYPYTQRFHDLAEILRTRLSATKRLQVAKAIASVRPSMILCVSSLSYYDLTFAEEYFQRAFREYKQFIRTSTTPNIICRRSGEIVDVNQGFLDLTRWQRSDLVREREVSDGETGGHVGVSPHHTLDTDNGESNAVPLFLAELIDEDSVVQFYEDFAQLAFGDSGCSVIGRTVAVARAKPQTLSDQDLTRVNDEEYLIRRKEEQGMQSVSGGDATAGHGHYPGGTIKCIMSWTLKRDLFEMPSLIVLSVSTWIRGS
jgi:PAS domain-containing protein